ncbi:hypothetical protein J1N35_011141, partial [Gossypium stocksii]
ATSTFNLPSYSKASTIINTRRLSSGKRLLWCNKGDALFGAKMVIVITQPINNYNRCHNDSSLTSSMLEHSLSS